MKRLIYDQKSRCKNALDIVAWVFFRAKLRTTERNRIFIEYRTSSFISISFWVKVTIISSSITVPPRNIHRAYCRSLLLPFPPYFLPFLSFLSHSLPPHSLPLHSLPSHCLPSHSLPPLPLLLWSQLTPTSLPFILLFSTSLLLITHLTPPTLLLVILYPTGLFLSILSYLLLSCFLYSWNLLRVTYHSVCGNLFYLISVNIRPFPNLFSLIAPQPLSAKISHKHSGILYISFFNFQKKKIFNCW